MRRAEGGKIVLIHNRFFFLHISEVRAAILYRCRCISHHGSLVCTRTRSPVYRGRS